VIGRALSATAQHNSARRSVTSGHEPSFVHQALFLLQLDRVKSMVPNGWYISHRSLDRTSGMPGRQYHIGIPQVLAQDVLGLLVQLVRLVQT
jgi:hypothetical protein